jgi:hypothetical protein
MNRREMLRQELLAIGNYHSSEKMTICGIIKALKKRPYYYLRTPTIVDVMAYYFYKTEGGGDEKAEDSLDRHGDDGT